MSEKITPEQAKQLAKILTDVMVASIGGETGTKAERDQCDVLEQILQSDIDEAITAKKCDQKVVSSVLLAVLAKSLVMQLAEKTPKGQTIDPKAAQQVIEHVDSGLRMYVAMGCSKHAREAKKS